MNDDIDRLLEKGLLEPPPQFTTRIMQRLESTPQLPSWRARLREWFQRLAVAGAALLGLAQLASFLFGLWIPATAG